MELNFKCKERFLLNVYCLKHPKDPLVFPREAVGENNHLKSPNFFPTDNDLYFAFSAGF